MSALSLVLLLLGAPVVVALCATILVSLAGLRRELASLRAQVRVPAEPTLTRACIRDAVSEALAEERERELAEARAFWAAQEAAQGHAAAPVAEGAAEPDAAEIPLSAELRAEFERQFGDALREAVDELALDEPTTVAQDTLGDGGPAALEPAENPGPAPDGSPPPRTSNTGEHRTDRDERGHQGDQDGREDEPAPDVRRHPSHPDFRPSPALGDRQRTLDRLEHLAETGTPLTDVRPGPLGTLDVYVFADDTMLCVTPGDHVASGRLTRALDHGRTARLLGGSGLGGGYTLTFGIGDSSVFVVADRVVASM
ncbi:hypothetical protein AQ490_23105 [Wenjunlia vitaminophila]|uniref:Secreted protein n=1 Tax=Wenjunlia vitaminophila TaxID=76728 RepID=A0A0T6LRM2_WENVI|nr:hypothetical protein [Wenjunlia vitaminophila]KRV48763.1 hypothetical protein AQ490_23105 [Wenjunlia vitaminophila]